jgi:D-arabinose 1-dehydrogenase-like Zn-dependent alcohol dehydrogenase
MNPPAQLNRIFFQQLSIVGSTMGTRAELEALVELCVARGIRPLVDRVLPLADVRDGLAAMWEGNVQGKIVLVP